MALNWIPFTLFPIVAVVCAVLAWRLRTRSRGLASASAALAVVAGLLVAFEFYAISAGANIRIDLLLTIPAVAVGAAAIGVALSRARESRILSAGLATAGSAVFAVFCWSMVVTGIESQRLSRVFVEARRLYWEETARCEGTFEKRFGTLPREVSCGGHFVVARRSENPYPFTRVIVNDKRDAFLLYSPESGVEENWMLDDAPSARLEAAPDGTLSGSCANCGRNVAIVLRPAAGGACQARVDSDGRSSDLTLERARLPPCVEQTNAPVRYLGAWGAIETFPDAGRYRQIIQVWLWQDGSSQRGVLLGVIELSGRTGGFNFVKRLHAEASAPGRFVVAGKDSGHLEIARQGDDLRVSGTALPYRARAGRVLTRGELVTHPKIALIPLGDAGRFHRYFDSLFENLSVPWTAP